MGVGSSCWAGDAIVPKGTGERQVHSRCAPGETSLSQGALQGCPVRHTFEKGQGEVQTTRPNSCRHTLGTHAPRTFQPYTRKTQKPRLPEKESFCQGSEGTNVIVSLVREHLVDEVCEAQAGPRSEGLAQLQNLPQTWPGLCCLSVTARLLPRDDAESNTVSHWHSGQNSFKLPL